MVLRGKCNDLFGSYLGPLRANQRLLSRSVQHILPQWCYFIFPPPPPFDVAGTSSDDSAGPVFSPLVIAIIGVLASAFLLVSYYTFISKYCGTFSSFRARVFSSGSGDAAHSGGGHGRVHGQSRSQESWNVSPPSGWTRP
ncbi:hypothetical protein GUJ93_ZPchr0014g46961 [Zizania palustris]|uniref:RING-type E3 ubiquitin transferase n=1 Tax=Zizania palustris TaxID=103762 RepID=A0A8J5VV92_ZIZPA|nr:hypothetical protein GUJ93_ZPchr0014g46961 [Zizania palustris]